MKTQSTSTTGTGIAGEIALLVRILDESYEKKAWHGPNLKGSIRRVRCGRSSLASPTRPSFDCRSRGARRLLEVRRTPAAAWRQARLVRAQGKQLVRAAVAAFRVELERVRHPARSRTSAAPRHRRRISRRSLAFLPRGRKVAVRLPDPWHRDARRLPRGPDPAPQETSSGTRIDLSPTAESSTSSFAPRKDSRSRFIV